MENAEEKPNHGIGRWLAFKSLMIAFISIVGMTPMLFMSVYVDLIQYDTFKTMILSYVYLSLVMEVAFWIDNKSGVKLDVLYRFKSGGKK